MEPIRVGILEFGDLHLGAVVDVARLAEELGFSRYWLAEHFGAVYENSLLMTAIVAGRTSRIRVGPAGVLLRYYAATAVARDGLLLERSFGRVDLGLSTGFIPDDEAEAHFADGRGDVRSRERLDQRMEAVAQWLSASDAPEQRPELWLLGGTGSTHRATLAARLDAHFALSLLHSRTTPSPAPIHAYREATAKLGKQPGTAVVALPLACVESEEDRRGHVMAHGGVLVPPFVGTPRQCRERIEEVCHAYDVREVSILECSGELQRRCDSLRMLADAFGGLPGPPPKGKVPSP